MANKVTNVTLDWSKHYRIIPSKYPPINFFENLVSPDLMDEVFFIESLTNDRLRDEVGDISLVAKEDRVSGAGSSYVMAAFTHPAPGRFSDGSYGVYYASRHLETAIRETVFHTERLLSYTSEPAGTHIRRVLQGKSIVKQLADIRSKTYDKYHHPDEVIESQKFAKALRDEKSSGIIYRSVRHAKGENIAIFKPNAIKLPIIQTKHLEYYWDGKRVSHYLEITDAVMLD